MASNVGKREIAHKGSGHGACAPGAISLVPGTPPVPTPFVYTTKTANIKEERKRYTIGGNGVLLDGDAMDLDPPANTGSQGDIVTQAIAKLAVMQTGAGCMTITGKAICVTGDIVEMNVPTAEMKLAQMSVPLLGSADFDAAKKSSAHAAKVNKKWLLAHHPTLAEQTKVGDPIDVATGFVVDTGVDFTLPGPVDLVWRRTYSSGFHERRSALGKGGWVHSFEQWIEPHESIVRLHDEEGLAVDFPAPRPNEVSFHRGRRLELRAAGKRYQIRSLNDRVVREFGPLADGRVALLSIVDPYMHRVDFEYEGSLLVRIVDAVGRQVRVTNDAKGRVSRVEVWAWDPHHLAEERREHGQARNDEPLSLKTWFEYAYHPEGTLASHANALSHVKRWEYDGLHRMVKTTDRNGLSFFYEYDEETGRCVRTFGEGGLHDVHLVMDAVKGEVLTHGTARARRYFIKDGIVLREETLDGSFARERELDADRLLIKASDASGESFSCVHDARGNRIKETDPSGNVVLWEYQEDAPVRRVDSAGLETRYHYDGHRALVGITFPTGAGYRMTRDNHGRITSVFDVNGTLATFTYDDHGNVASEMSARGETTRYLHDALGRLVKQQNPDGNVTQVDHDALGQAVCITYPDRSQRLASYDPVGNVTSSTDTAGRVTRMEYSGTGHLARLVAPDGQVVAIKHDADERPVEVLDERLQRYRREYDRADRIVSESTFDGRHLEYRYNRAGRVVRIDYPDGEWRELQHDKLGNVIEDRGPDVQITFERDGTGRLVRAVCSDVMATVVTEIERDEWRRVVAEKQDGRTLRHEYDGYGRRTARIVADGDRTEYRYDGDDLLVGVSHGDRSVAIQRDWEGRERVRESGSWRLDTERDSLGRRSLDRVTAFDQGRWTPVLSRRFSYDAAGRLVALADSRRGVATYGYDPSDRLTGAADGDLREAFEYDPTGSLVGAVRARGADREDAQERWSLGPGNVLKTAGDTRYRYDGRGRRIQRVETDRTAKGPDRVTLYGWDTKDRLREVVLPDGKRVRFTYDAFDRRVRKTVLSAPNSESPAIAAATVEATVDYLWDGNVICEERHHAASGQRARLHVHTPGTFTPLLQIEGGSVFGVIVNQVGVVTDLVDDRGRVAWQARHGAWGDVVAVDREPHTAAVESPFRLLGQIADEETGLCSTRFRYFEAEHGRWLSPDPLQIEGGLNHMAFGGAPTLSSDAWGLSTYDSWQPHSPSDDWFGKGTHFYTNNDKVEIGVRLNKKGDVDFERVAGKKEGKSEAGPQVERAREKLKGDAAWRWKLLKNLAEGIRQLSTDENAGKRDFGKEMDPVRAALAKLIANKGN